MADIIRFIIYPISRFVTGYVMGYFMYWLIVLIAEFFSK